MFRLDTKIKEAFKVKYNTLPYVIDRTTWKYSILILDQSLKLFIDKELKDLDTVLYDIFYYDDSNKRRRKGYGRLSIIKCFRNPKPNYLPSRDLIDLLCYYAYNIDGKSAISQGKISNTMDEYLSLKSQRVYERNEIKCIDIEGKRMYLKHDEEVESDPNSKRKFIRLNVEDIEQLEGFDDEQVIPWVIIKKRIAENDKILFAIEKISSNGTKRVIQGFFIIYPINKQCEKLLENNKIQGSDEFDIEHISANFDSVSAIYISRFFALKKEYNNPIIQDFLNMTHHILVKHKNIKMVYIRPGNKDAAKIIKDYQYKPINSSSDVCCKSSKDLLRTFET